MTGVGLQPGGLAARLFQAGEQSLKWGLLGPFNKQLVDVASVCRPTSVDGLASKVTIKSSLWHSCLAPEHGACGFPSATFSKVLS